MRRTEPAPTGSIRPTLLAAAVLLSAGCLLIATTAQPVAARPPDAHSASYYKECGHLQTFVGVLAHDLTCHKALHVARSYLAGNHHPLGFHCARVNVNAAAGHYTHCTKHPAAVNIAPE